MMRVFFCEGPDAKMEALSAAGDRHPRRRGGSPDAADDRPFGPRSCRVERDAKTHRILAPRISPPVVMGFAALNPSLYQRESLQCDRSVRNDPARVATWAGSPIVGSQPIAAFEG